MENIANLIPGSPGTVGTRHFCPLHKHQYRIFLPDDLVERAVETIQRTANTGRIGDGKIFVLDIAHAVRIRTGETGASAL